MLEESARSLETIGYYIESARNNSRVGIANKGSKPEQLPSLYSNYLNDAVEVVDVEVIRDQSEEEEDEEVGEEVPFEPPSITPEICLQNPKRHHKVNITAKNTTAATRTT